MNCDQVFQILTRGPFPSGEPTDRAVERHLASCPGCYQLAEALRPAIELFQEAIHSEEGRDLPGYWGELIDPPFAERGPLAQVVRLPALLQRRFDRGRIWIARRAGNSGPRVAAAVLIGAVLGIVLWKAGIGDDSAPARQSASTARQPEMTSRDSLAEPWQPPLVVEAALPAGQLAPACWLALRGEPAADPNGATSVLGSAAFSRLQCCTDCHNRGSGVSAPHATAAVARSCAQCHK